MVLNLWTFEALYSDTVGVILAHYLWTREIRIFHGYVSNPVNNRIADINGNNMYTTNAIITLWDDATVWRWVTMLASIVALSDV